MPDEPQRALEEANEIISGLAYCIRSCDQDAALRIMEGFGEALAESAPLRAAGMNATAIALALAERAGALSQVKDPRHAGWLLVSVKVELLHLARSQATLLGGQSAELLRELDEIVLELLRKGTTALA